MICSFGLESLIWHKRCTHLVLPMIYKYSVFVHCLMAMDYSTKKKKGGGGEDAALPGVIEEIESRFSGDLIKNWDFQE